MKPGYTEIIFMIKCAELNQWQFIEIHRNIYKETNMLQVRVNFDVTGTHANNIKLLDNIPRIIII